MRGGVADLLPKPISGATAPGFAPGKVPKADPNPGAGEALVVAPRTTGGFVPKRGPDMNLESGAGSGASVLGSTFGMRLNVPGFIPAPNRLGGVIVGFVASSSENPPKFSVGTGTLVTAGVGKEDEGLSSGAVLFVKSTGGVFGLAVTDEAGALNSWSTKGSTLAGGGVNLASAGEGEVALEEAVSHCPNGIFGDAGRGLSEEPLTSSSSPPDTGAFARGELRSGRVLGLPRLVLEAGDGVSDGEGSVGIGCCNDNGSLDGDPGGVVLRKRTVDGS